MARSVHTGAAFPVWVTAIVGRCAWPPCLTTLRPGRLTPRSPRWLTTTGWSSPGTLFFCVRGFTRDGHDFAPDAVASGAAALVVERPLSLGVPEVLVGVGRARRWRRRRRAFHGDPTAQLQTRRGDRDQRQDDDAPSWSGRCSRPPGASPGLLGTVKSVIGGVEHEVLSAPRRRRSTFSARSREMLDAGDRACVMEVSSHALELHRADAIHFAAAIFTNLTQDHLDFHPTMEDYFPAKRRLFTELEPGACGRQRRRPLRRAARRRAGRRRDHVRARARRRLPRRRCADGPRRLAVRRDRAGRRVRARFAAAGALQRLQRARSVRGRPCARAWPRGTAVEAIAARRPGARAASSRSTRARTSPCWSTTPTPLTRWRTCCRAARALTRGRLHVRLRLRRGPRPRQAPADGGDRGPSGRSRHRHLRQPPLRGPRGDHRRDPGRERSPTWSMRSTVASPSSTRSPQPRPGDVVVIAGKGHEQGQEFAGGRKIPFDDVTVAREILRGTASNAATPTR